MTTTTLVNLTPHPVTWIRNGERLTPIPPSGPPARCAEVRTVGGTIPGTNLPYVEISYGDVTGLPPQRDGVVYIVSQMVCAALPHRTDLVYPTGLERDDEGRIIGCTGFARRHPADDQVSTVADARDAVDRASRVLREAVRYAVHSGQPVTAVADAAKTTRSTVYRWLKEENS